MISRDTPFFPPPTRRPICCQAVNAILRPLRPLVRTAGLCPCFTGNRGNDRPFWYREGSEARFNGLRPPDPPQDLPGSEFHAGFGWMPSLHEAGQRCADSLFWFVHSNEKFPPTFPGRPLLGPNRGMFVGEFHRFPERPVPQVTVKGVIFPISRP